MRVQTLIAIEAAGIGVCAACGEDRERVRILIGLHGEEPTREAKVCTRCLITPGISITANVDVVHPLDQAAFKAKKLKSKKGERKTAKEVRGRTTLASGATLCDGDVVNSDWMIEEKNWAVKSLTRVTGTLLKKTSAQASKQGKSWVLRLRITGYDLAVMLWSDALELVRSDDES